MSSHIYRINNDPFRCNDHRRYIKEKPRLLRTIIMSRSKNITYIICYIHYRYIYYALNIIKIDRVINQPQIADIKLSEYRLFDLKTFRMDSLNFYRRKGCVVQYYICASETVKRPCLLSLCVLSFWKEKNNAICRA